MDRVTLKGFRCTNRRLGKTPFSVLVAAGNNLSLGRRYATLAEVNGKMVHLLMNPPVDLKAVYLRVHYTTPSGKQAEWTKVVYIASATYYLPT